MSANKQKVKLMAGMPVGAAKKKLREIYAKEFPEDNFEKKYPGIYVWMETWFRLRSRNETFEAVAQAFAEKVSRLHKEKHALGKRIHAQREELVKRLKKLDEAKSQSSLLEEAIERLKVAAIALRHGDLGSRDKEIIARDIEDFLKRSKKGTDARS